ncbi:hypothetical protein M0813_12742 [Anaeramoeba flamelloides]|uniref:Uncharacterized protein n=1 Tax=Anaeramoeba flamelloides TaxID=1746091 RepID=A0ABQ8ZBF2_9EUKA|nr:hypothetical protein M0813_12742 [Anaeramoeba flamelloides]
MSFESTLGKPISTKRLFGKEIKRKTHKNTVLESHLLLQNLLQKKNQRRTMSNTFEFEIPKNQQKKKKRKKGKEFSQTIIKKKKNSLNFLPPSLSQRPKSEQKQKRLFNKEPNQKQVLTTKRSRIQNNKYYTPQKRTSRSPKNDKESKFEKLNRFGSQSDLSRQPNNLFKTNKTTNTRISSPNNGNSLPNNSETGNNKRFKSHQKQDPEKTKGESSTHPSTKKKQDYRTNNNKEDSSTFKTQETLRKENENLRKQIKNNQTKIRDLEKTIKVHQLTEKKMKNILLSLSKNLTKTTLELTNERKKTQTIRNEARDLNNTLHSRDITIIQLSTDLDKTKRKSRKRFNSKLTVEKKRAQLVSKLSSHQHEFYQFRIKFRSLKESHSKLHKKNLKLMNEKSIAQLEIKKTFNQTQEQILLICKQYFKKMAFIENICDNSISFLSNLETNENKEFGSLTGLKKRNKNLDYLENGHYTKNKEFKTTNNERNSYKSNNNKNKNKNNTNNNNNNSNKIELTHLIQVFEKIKTEINKPIHGFQFNENSLNLDLATILKNFKQIKSTFTIYKNILNIFQSLIIPKFQNNKKNKTRNNKKYYDKRKFDKHFKYQND